MQSSKTITLAIISALSVFMLNGCNNAAQMVSGVSMPDLQFVEESNAMSNTCSECISSVEGPKTQNNTSTGNLPINSENSLSEQPNGMEDLVTSITNPDNENISSVQSLNSQSIYEPQTGSTSTAQNKDQNTDLKPIISSSNPVSTNSSSDIPATSNIEPVQSSSIPNNSEQSKPAVFSSTISSTPESTHFFEHHQHSYEIIYETVNCVTNGYRLYGCSCSDQFEETINPIGHSYIIDSIYEPECAFEGWTNFMCERCGDRYVGDYVPALGHDYTKENIPATCIQNGWTNFICKRCGDRYVGDYVPALG